MNSSMKTLFASFSIGILSMSCGEATNTDHFDNRNQASEFDQIGLDEDKGSSFQLSVSEIKSFADRMFKIRFVKSPENSNIYDLYANFKIFDGATAKQIGACQAMSYSPEDPWIARINGLHQHSKELLCGYISSMSANDNIQLVNHGSYHRGYNPNVIGNKFSGYTSFSSPRSLIYKNAIDSDEVFQLQLLEKNVIGHSPSAPPARDNIPLQISLTSNLISEKQSVVIEFCPSYGSESQPCQRKTVHGSNDLVASTASYTFSAPLFRSGTMSGGTLCITADPINTRKDRSSATKCKSYTWGIHAMTNQVEVGLEAIASLEKDTQGNTVKRWAKVTGNKKSNLYQFEKVGPTSFWRSSSGILRATLPSLSWNLLSK